MNVVEQITFDDSKAISSLQNLAKNIAQVEKGVNDLQNKTKTASDNVSQSVGKSARAAEKAVDKTVEANKKTSASFKDVAGSMGAMGVVLMTITDRVKTYRGVFKGFLKDHVNWGRLSETNIRGVNTLANAIGGGSKAITVFAKGMNIMKSALISTGIGALIVGLGSLIAFFTQTQRGMDIIGQKTAYVGAAFRKLTDFVGEMGGKLFDAFDKPKEAVGDLWAAIKDNLLNRLGALPLFFTAIGSSIKALFSGDWEGLKQAGVDAASAVAQALTGLDKEQQKSVIDGIENLGSEMNKAGKAAENLRAQFQELERAKIRFTKVESDLNAKIEEQREISKDVSKSLKERVIAARKAAEIDNQIDEKKLALAARNLNLIQQENALRKKNDKDLTREAQAYTEYVNLKAENYRENIKFNKVINQTTEAAIDRYKEAAAIVYDLAEQFNILSEAQKRSTDRETQKADLAKLKADIQELIDLQIELSQNSDTQNVKLIDVNDAKKQLEEIDKLVTAIIKTEDIDKILDESRSKELDTIQEIQERSVLSEAEKQEKIKDLKLKGELERLQISMSGMDKETEAYKNAQIRKNEIVNEINDPKRLEKILLDEVSKRQSYEEIAAYQSITNKEKLEKKLTEIKNQGEIDRLTIENQFLDSFSAKYAENLAKISELNSKGVIPSGWWDDVNTFEGLWNKFLDDTFGSSTSGKIKEFANGLGAFMSTLGALLDANTDNQLKQLDKLLENVGEKKQKAEDDLNAERELFEQGLANSYESTKLTYDNLIAEEKRLNAEKEKIQAKAEKRQMIADTVQQTGSLITSSINIIKGFSQIPIVGLPLGIAAVGALLAFFIKTKADAFKATKLYTGAEKISDHFGFAKKGGESDLPGQSGKGYRLVSERSGNPTNVIISGNEMLIPETISKKQAAFFANLRAGLYDEIDLSQVLGHYKSFSVPKKLPAKSGVDQRLTAAISPPKSHHLIPLDDNRYLIYEIGPGQGHGSIIQIKK